ncbi:MAG: methyl-accepting chemotaxis protein [Candidatus Omnitrophica bacterium]|nr:methyl-accepting chemotaxis protein [Candidatus Omnitrophota bacterium]
MKLSWKFSLGKKLIGGFSIVAALVVVAGITGIMSADRISRGAFHLIDKNIPLKDAAGKILLSLKTTEESCAAYTWELKNLAQTQKQIRENFADFRMYLCALRYGTESEQFIKSEEGKRFAQKSLSLKIPEPDAEIIARADKVLALSTEFSAGIDALLKIHDERVKFFTLFQGEMVPLQQFVLKAEQECTRFIDLLTEAARNGVNAGGVRNLNDTVFGKWYLSFIATNEELEVFVGLVYDAYEKLMQFAVRLDNAPSSQKMALVEQNRFIFKNVLASFDAFFEYLNPTTQKINADEAAVLKKLADISHAVEIQVMDLNKYADDISAQTQTAVGQAKASANTILPIVVVIAVVISLLLGVLISRGIVMIVNQINEVTKQIAAGDLRVAAEIKSGDEFETLGENINRMVVGLNDIIVKVKTAAEDLGAVTGEIAGNSQRISDGAQQQSSSFEELSGSVQNSSNTAAQANKISQATAQNVHKAGQAMEQTMEAMSAIERTSTQISEVVGIITDIADQTNLLALNAAIEAARAGEHGKGFAVVADEVRKLAERSASSAKEIENLIRGSSGQVENGAKLLNNAGENLKVIISDITDVVRQVQMISTTTEEQAATMEQNTSITETNATASEALAVSSQHMAEQAAALRNMVAQFKVRDKEQDAGPAAKKHATATPAREGTAPSAGNSEGVPAARQSVVPPAGSNIRKTGLAPSPAVPRPLGPSGARPPVHHASGPASPAGKGKLSAAEPKHNPVRVKHAARPAQAPLEINTPPEDSGRDSEESLRIG